MTWFGGFRAAGAVAALGVLAPVSGCGAGVETGPSSAGQPPGLIGPVTMSVHGLSGAIVHLTVGRVLNIDTGDVPVTSYRGQVADPAVASFVAGRNDGSARFNPGVVARAPGITEVAMTAGSTAEPVRFTVVVAPR